MRLQQAVIYGTAAALQSGPDVTEGEQIYEHSALSISVVVEAQNCYKNIVPLTRLCSRAILGM